MYKIAEKLGSYPCFFLKIIVSRSGPNKIYFFGGKCSKCDALNLFEMNYYEVKDLNSNNLPKFEVIVAFNFWFDR